MPLTHPRGAPGPLLAVRVKKAEYQPCAFVLVIPGRGILCVFQEPMDFCAACQFPRRLWAEGAPKSWLWVASDGSSSYQRGYLVFRRNALEKRTQLEIKNAVFSGSHVTREPLYDRTRIESSHNLSDAEPRTTTSVITGTRCSHVFRQDGEDSSECFNITISSQKEVYLIPYNTSGGQAGRK